LSTCAELWIPNSQWTLFKQIQDCADYSEAGVSSLVTRKISTLGTQKYLQQASACRRWNEKPTAEKTWTQFKSHFAAPHCQHKQMQGESAATAGYHSANATVTQNEDHMAEADIGALANLATATAAYRGVVAALTQANSRLAKQLEEISSELRELKALLNQERREKQGPRSLNPSASNYCWKHGYKVGLTHTSLTCNTPTHSHKTEATRADNMGGSQANRE
jgi:hypothetical protein